RIKTANGPVWLTVPVGKKGSFESPINQIRINHDRPWPKTHLTTIQQAYAKAPYFEKYRPILQEFYGGQPELLADFTIETTIRISRLLGITHTRFVRSSELGTEGTKTNRLV